MEETLTTLFKREEVFDTTLYIPETFEYRNSQIAEIIRAIKPGLTNNKPQNKIILGKQSSGKTTAIRKVFQTINENTQKIKTVYVNCRINDIEKEIYKRIAISLYGNKINYKMQKEELYSRIIDYCVKNNVTLVICLDDIDNIHNIHIINKMMYELLRSGESFFVKISIIAIISRPELISLLDRRVKNFFLSNEIKFPDYTKEEIYNILKKRCEKGLIHGTISDEIIYSLASYCYRESDLRSAIETLRSAVVLAEIEGSLAIEEWHIRDCLCL
ncbi:AAA family ATPase [Methanobrevibacter sp. OttesenSCG-928-I08]|nr:AAA family ATPase [Methanobrevibacter sp. OttesenSCG-928-I08]